MIDADPDLLAFLREEETRSRNEELLSKAETALKSYNGEPYGDEEEGRSQVVTRDVAEVIDQMEVSVLRVFVSGDRVAEFEPTHEEEVQAADDATEAIQRQFSRKGYQLLHDWFKEGNLSTLGIVKTVAEQKKRRATVLTASPEEDGAIEADSIGVDPETGMEMYQAVILQDGPVEFKDYLVPLEEFRVSPDARDVDDAAYVAHATPKTLSELVEMGFDRDEVEDLRGDMSAEQLSFTRDDGNSNFHTSDRTGAMRRVLLLEEYVRFDLDGDGIAERLCVHRVGDHILKIEATDYQPFVVYCPFPMPGRLAGHSLADKVIDIQRVNTVLNRLGLDGLYMNLAPGTDIHEDSISENTLDDFLTVRPGRIRRWKGSIAPTTEPKNDVSGIAWQAMEFMIGQREARTGITRLNQGLDADSLNKTATGTALMQAQGQQMEEYLARNFGEAVVRLMRLKLKLHVRYGGEIQMRVDGEFRKANPQEWNEEMDVVIRVGLGSGKKEQRLMNRQLILQIQREIMMAGGKIVNWDHVHKSFSGLIKDASVGSPSDYVADPKSLQIQNPETGEMEDPPSPPSPEEQKLQAEMQMQSAKIQGDQQLQAAKMQGEQQLSAAKLEALREEAQIKAQLARDEATAAAKLASAKAQAELELAERKFQAEMMMAKRKMEFEAQAASRDADRRDYETEGKLSQNRKGGKLDE